MDSDVFKEDYFEDNHVVITGGSSGVGLGIARRFASKSADVSLIARDEGKLETASDELRDDFGAGSQYFSSDVRNYEDLEASIDSAVDEYGSIDVLVCAAAGNFPAAAAEMSSNAFKSVIDIDVMGTFNTCRASHKYMESSGSNIIAISAPQSVQPTPLQSHACTAKAGVDSLIRTLALEWSEDGIRANAIQPGPVKDTEGLKRLVPDEKTKEKLHDVLPTGRLVDKEEIGDLCLYLASSLAQSITGAVIPVDGGQMLIGSGGMAQIFDLG